MGQQPPHQDDDYDRIETLWERTRMAAREAMIWGKKVSKIGNLKIAQHKLKRQKSEVLQELGARVYTLLKEGRFSPLELQELVHELDDIHHQIETIQNELDQVLHQESKGSSLFSNS